MAKKPYVGIYKEIVGFTPVLKRLGHEGYYRWKALLRGAQARLPSRPPHRKSSSSAYSSSSTAATENLLALTQRRLEVEWEARTVLGVLENTMRELVQLHSSIDWKCTKLILPPHSTPPSKPPEIPLLEDHINRHPIDINTRKLTVKARDDARAARCKDNRLSRGGKRTGEQLWKRNCHEHLLFYCSSSLPCAGCMHFPPASEDNLFAREFSLSHFD